MSVPNKSSSDNLVKMVSAALTLKKWLKAPRRFPWFRELHSFTRSCIVDEPVAANRGSRPGSPPADSPFHLAIWLLVFVRWKNGLLGDRKDRPP